MPFMLIVLVIFGTVIYSFFTLFSYLGTSSTLSKRLQEVRASLDQNQQRLAEYQARVEHLDDEVPERRIRCSRLKQWSALLKQQQARLEVEHAQKKQKDERREGNVRKALRGRRLRGLGN